MSRTSNRGPRADIALLRKLKADPSFSPSSLLNTGPNILEKANKLKDFVENQRGKLGAAAAKTEWLLAYQQLQGDQDDAERELTACVQQLADNPAADQLRGMAEVALVTLYDTVESCRVERQQLRSQARGLSSVHASLKAYGVPEEFSREATALKGEMSAVAQELEATLKQLAEESAALTAELREVWPSALAAPDSGVGGGLAAVASASSPGSSSGAAAAGESTGQVLPGYSASEDFEELHRMLARYPLASNDIKERVRDVFGALQEKFLERLETWRLEADQAARDLAVTATSTSASTIPQQPSRRAPHHTAASTTARASTTTGGGKPNPSAATAPGRAAGPACLPGPRGSAAAGRGTRLEGGRGGAGRGQGPAAAAAAGGGSPGPPPPAGGGTAGAASSAPKPAVAPRRASSSRSDSGCGPEGSGAAAAESDEAMREAAEDRAAADGVVGSEFGRAGAVGGGSSGWAFAGYGGWSAEEHSAFVRHRDRLMKEGGQGGSKSLSREAVMTRMVTLLPGRRTVAELLAHDDWTTAARLLGRKRRDLAEAWDRERRQYLEDSASFLQESETLFLVRAEEAADRLVAELQRVRARDNLEELRVERAREEEVAAAERALQEAAEAEARLRAEARERQQRALKKDLVAAYRVELERQQAELLAAAAEAERQAAAAAEQLALYNRERVEVRQAEYQVRQEQVKERQAAAEAEAAAREARLARLRALVAPEVESDPERLLAPTTASSAADKDKGVQGAFNPVNGYTTEQVVKDQRFKVFEALAVLGLHETSYGRQAIAAARPAQPSRPDNFTSEQREAMCRR